MIKYDLLSEDDKPLLKYNMQFFADEGDGAEGAGDGDDDQDDADQEDKEPDGKGKKSDKAPKGKYYTQDDIDDMITKRLERERKKQKPSREDKPADKPEDKAKATEDKVSALEAKLLCYEHDVAKDSVSDVVALARSYVDEDTDFETAIEKVIKKYPQFVKGAEKKRDSDEDNDEDDEDGTDKQKGSWGQRQKGQGRKVDPVEEAFLKRNPDLKI